MAILMKTKLAQTVSTAAPSANNLQSTSDDDVILIGNPAFVAATTAMDGAGGNDEIRFTSTTNGQTLVLTNANVNNIEFVTISTDTASAEVSGTPAGSANLNIDAGAVTARSLNIAGNSGNNAITGTAMDDALSGNGGNDVFLIKNGADHGIGEVIDGGTGNDEIRFTSTMDDDTLFLSEFVDVEVVRISNAAGGSSGTKSLNIDASLVAAPDLAAANGKLSLIGNGGENVISGSFLLGNLITGGGGSDVLIGGSRDDVFIIDAAGDYAAGEFIDGDAGQDSISFRGTGLLKLNAEVRSIESIDLGVMPQNNGVDASAVVNGLFILGNGGKNNITGTNANDTIIGGGGADTLGGGNGDDGFVIDKGATDVIKGGAGFDVLFFQNTSATAADRTLTLGATSDGLEQIAIGIFTPNPEGGVLDNSGTTNNNINAAALAANASIQVVGNWGDNTVTGGAGNDSIEGSYGRDTLQGGKGDDFFLVRNAAEYNTLTGDDSVDGGDGMDTLVFNDAGPGLLVLNAGLKDVERLDLFSNNDGDPEAQSDVDMSVDASALTTRGIAIRGNDGNNTITGSKFVDNIQAGDGNDTVVVALATHHGAREMIDGGGGYDELRFTSTVNKDTLVLNAGDKGIELVTLNLDANGDTNTAATRVNASAYKNDLTIIGNDGNNVITGGRGDDQITAGGGDDSAGGGFGDDEINGGAGKDILSGGLGDDALFGGDGNDTLIGGEGNDQLSGGNGNDHFVFNTPLNKDANVDLIHDFAYGSDIIDLKAKLFSGIGNVGATLSTTNFLSGDGAVDGDAAHAMIVLNAETGALYYDPTGSATSGDAIQFAQLESGAAFVTASDFHLVA